MNVRSEPVTIFPNQYHSFRSDVGATVVEFSTKHDDSDVYRLVESSGG